MIGGVFIGLLKSYNTTFRLFTYLISFGSKFKFLIFSYYFRWRKLKCRVLSKK